MKKKLMFFLFLPVMALSQIGINTLNPNSTLTVQGSFEASYEEFSTDNFLINDSHHYLSYVGDTLSTATLPVIGAGVSSYTGRIYKIKNLSNYNLILQASSGDYLRSDNNPIPAFLIPPSGYVEAVNNSNVNGGTWDLSFTGNSDISTNVQFYGNQLKIPPHSKWVGDFSNHSTTAYDTPATTSDAAWWVVSKISYSVTTNQPARMDIVYEYQGTPLDVMDVYPILTTGNNTSAPDVYVPASKSLVNNGIGGKTRLTISVVRVDDFTTNTIADWKETFSLNILLAKRP